MRNCHCRSSVVWGVVLGGFIAVAALLLLQAPASASADIDGARPTRSAEAADRTAQIRADMEARTLALQAQVAERRAEVVAEVETRVVAKRAEVAARLSQSQSAAAGCGCMPVGGMGSPATFTLDGDFDKGDLNNVVHTPSDQLQLAEQTSPFPFLWVAVSSRVGLPNNPANKGTIVKIDTRTRKIVGEYWTSPQGQAANPSRTTVDPWGNVWATNRAGNSVVRIGMVENHQCIDHNGLLGIQTSTGQGDVRPWTNAGSKDTGGGVSTAQDDCVIAYTRTTSHGTRHISVSLSQDVWVSGVSGPGKGSFDLISPDGTLLRTEPSVGYGGYGGLTDKQGVVWSAGPFTDVRFDTLGLLRWQTVKNGKDVPLTGLQLAPSFPAPANGDVTGYPGTIPYPPNPPANLYGDASYGLCIDSAGNVWNTDRFRGYTRKFAPNGMLLGRFDHHSRRGSRLCRRPR